MKREEVLSLLKAVSPALVGKGLLPVLSHFCLDGKTIMAYDGVVALQTRCDWPLHGGLPGEVLLSVLAASRAKEVKIEVLDSTVLLIAGRTKLKLALLPAEDFIFSPPKYRGKKVLLTDSFREAVALASRSSAENIHTSSLSGVTLHFQKSEVVLYSTDAATSVKVRAPCESADLKGTVLILPKRFHSLLQEIGAKELLLTQEGDIICKSNLVRLYGKVVQGADSSMYENMLTAVVPENLQFAKIPTGLSRCLERALLLNKETTRFSYADGRLEVFTEGGGSELRDSIKLSLDIPPIVVYTCAEYLLRYLDAVDFIGISDRCFVLKGDNCQVVVAVKS